MALLNGPFSMIAEAEDADAHLGLRYRTTVERNPKTGVVMLTQTTWVTPSAEPHSIDMVALSPATQAALRTLYEAVLALPRPAGSKTPPAATRSQAASQGPRTPPPDERWERAAATVADPDRTTGVLLFILLENQAAVIRHEETIAQLPGLVFARLASVMIDEAYLLEAEPAPGALRKAVYEKEPRAAEALWRLLEDLDGDKMKATYDAARWEKLARQHIAKWAAAAR